MEAILEKRKSRETENTLRNIGVFYIKKNQMFPNIVRILSIILTTPAMSASIERTNSALPYVITNFLSTVSEGRFNALVLLYIHRDIKLNYKKIIAMYALHYPRTMVLKNLLT